MNADDLPEHVFPDAEAFHSWLREHHEQPEGIWLHFAKQGTGATTISRLDAVLTALCWGWIDGKAQRIDDTYFRIRFTPRRRRSVWSQVNVAHVERLIAEGRMQPSGLAQVEAAQADGRWDAAYSSFTNLEVPPELQAALDADPKAATAFAKRSKSERYSMCWRVQTAKRDDTKQRRAAQFVALLRADEPVR